MKHEMFPEIQNDVNYLHEIQNNQSKTHTNHKHIQNDSRKQPKDHKETQKYPNKTCNIYKQVKTNLKTNKLTTKFLKRDTRWH